MVNFGVSFDLLGQSDLPVSAMSSAAGRQRHPAIPQGESRTAYHLLSVTHPAGIMFSRIILYSEAFSLLCSKPF